MNEEDFFKNPNIYENFKPASSRIKKGFFEKIIPYKYFKYTFYSVLVLFISPILLVLLNLDLMKDEKILTPILWTLCLSFVSYAILAGAIFVVYKFPYMQELKEKFGYTER